MFKNIKIRYVALVLILLITLITLTSNYIDENRNLTFFEKAIKDTGIFVQKIFNMPINYVKDKVNMIGNSNDLYKKYNELKDKVNKTDLYYAQIEELQKEVTELKSVLELNATLSEYKYVNATVVNRNTLYWYDTINIDKGSKNGIKEGDAVITPFGLIGRITNISNFSSTVKLLTSDKINNKISVKIKTDDNLYQYGLLIGYEKKDKVYRIEGITNPDIVKEGDIVTTTGLTDYFPSGILIGTVKNIVKDEYDLSSIVEVIPAVSFEDISIVTVLNRKV